MIRPAVVLLWVASVVSAVVGAWFVLWGSATITFSSTGSGAAATTASDPYSAFGWLLVVGACCTAVGAFAADRHQRRRA